VFIKVWDIVPICVAHHQWIYNICHSMTEHKTVSERNKNNTQDRKENGQSLPLSAVDRRLQLHATAIYRLRTVAGGFPHDSGGGRRRC